MICRFLKSAFVLAVLAAPLAACDHAGSCLESSSALPGSRSVYTWCPDGWRKSRSGGTTTFRCPATNDTRSAERTAGGTDLSIAGNRSSQSACH